MTRALNSSLLSHPEAIHPALWRGSQLAHSYQKTVSTGYSQLDAHLPGQGWPMGVLIEILSAHAGIGEIQLLKPALLALPEDRSIMLINPPYIPSAFCLTRWFSRSRRVFWIRSETSGNAFWAAEKALQYDTNAALLFWFSGLHPVATHRLHLAARQSHTLFIGFRPASAASQSSISPLRLSLKPYIKGLDIRILKRQGPLLHTAIPLHLNKSDMRSFYHDALDQYSPTPSLSRQHHNAMAD